MTAEQRAAVTVVLYTRDQCPLCDSAYQLIASEARRCVVTVVDIEQDDELLKRYGMRIPVVSVNGQDIAEGNLGKGVVRAALRAVRRSHRRARAPRWRFWA